MYPFYLGIDLHLKRTYVVLMNYQGKVVDEIRLANEEMAAYLKKVVPRETYAVLASCNLVSCPRECPAPFLSQSC